MSSAAQIHDQGPPAAVMVAVALLLGALLAGGGLLAMRAGSAPAAEPVAAEPAAADPLAAPLESADQHFDANRFDLALDDYMAVLQEHPDHPMALARAGWIAFEGGDSALGERLLQRSLDVDGDNPEALWFLAQVRVHGTGDAHGAAVVLRTLLKRDDLSPSFRAQVERLLTEAGA